MSMYHVRLNGTVYGPFSLEQLQQLAAAGRVSPQSEISSDRNSWMPAAAILGRSPAPTPSAMATAGDAASRAHASLAAGSDCRKYLESLRNRTCYPFYRSTVLICSILGYVLAAVPLVSLGAKIFWSGISSLSEWEVLGCLAGALVLAAAVTVLREIFSMYADFVDSTLEHHSRGG